MEFKRAVLLIVIVFVGVSISTAQFIDSSGYNYIRPVKSQSSGVLNNSLSLAFGDGGYYPYHGESYLQSPGLIVSYENNTFKHIGPGTICTGVLVSYKQIGSNYTDYNTGFEYKQRWNYYILGARIIYRITGFPSAIIEPYAGVMLGYYINSFKFISDDPHYSEPSDPGYYLNSSSYPNILEPGIFAGIRSRLSSRGSVWFEAGYGFTSIAFGISYKF